MKTSKLETRINLKLGSGILNLILLLSLMKKQMIM